MEGPFEAKAVFGIVGDRQGPGLSSTARDELGEIRYGREGTVSALRALRAGQKFNTDTSPGPASATLLPPIPRSLLSSHSKTHHPSSFASILACIRVRVLSTA
jgi:hypothetical protein